MNSTATQTQPIATIGITYERDVVVARQQARRIAELAGFENQDQIRIATSVSELARNAYQYAGGGRVEVEADLQPGQTGLVVSVRDSGPGIADVNSILDGRYRSNTGMGKGIFGTRRLMDDFSISSTPEAGTQVRFVKRLPRRAAQLTPQKVVTIRQLLEQDVPDDPFYEIQRQNQELMRTLEELRTRQEELAMLNNELEATNRGVVALYAELDERANYLRKVSDLKSRFLSNMSHEFRTPLNSIRTLAGMLLERMDGALAPEQEKQVSYIQHAAEELGALVDDLLDLAKAEAGKLTVRLGAFDIASLFNILRGLLKPLTNESTVTLVFEEPQQEIVVYSDEAKVSQILRNFISNALKFTLQGEVRVSAQLIAGGSALFTVADTGIGIEAEHLEMIFEEFSQIESTVQNNVKGTGLGLPLSRRLAELLGGFVRVESSPGKGSRFYLTLPTNLELANSQAGQLPTQAPGKSALVLVIDDDQITRYVLETHLTRIGCRVSHAVDGMEGLRLAQSIPDLIFLDLSMPGISGMEVLKQLRSDEVTMSIPVIIDTSMELTPAVIDDLVDRGADAVVAKGETFPENATQALKQALGWKS